MNKFFISEVGSIVIEVEGLNKRNLKAVFILFIVALVSLLTTLRFAGILQEPTRESMTLEAIEWEFERPNQSVLVDNKLDATYAGNGFLLTMYIWIETYSENLQSGADYDYLTMWIMINASIQNPNSYIENVDVNLHKDNQSTVDWPETQCYLENLSLSVRLQGFWWRDDAYLRLAGVNKPDNVHLWAMAIWFLPTPNNQSHQMEATYELTYSNGTVRNKIVQPFQLKIVGS